MEAGPIQIDFSNDNLLALNISLGIIIFGVALSLNVSDFKRLLKKPRAAIAGLSSQLLILPAITFALVSLLDPVPGMALGMFMVAACPGGNISNFMALIARANPALSVSLTAVTSLTAVVLTPLNFLFWSGLYGPTAELQRSISIDFWQMLGNIFLVLILPIFLGLALNSFRPKLSAKIRRPISWLSLILFAVIVLLAIGKNLDLFRNWWSVFLSLVLTHNLLAFLGGYGWAALFGLESRDRRTLSIETGIQNSALALVLIFNFFDGMGEMALIAAFWGVWHILSGLGLASIWRYYFPIADNPEVG